MTVKKKRVYTEEGKCLAKARALELKVLKEEKALRGRTRMNDKVNDNFESLGEWRLREKR